MRLGGGFSVQRRLPRLGGGLLRLGETVRLPLAQGLICTLTSVSLGVALGLGTGVVVALSALVTAATSFAVSFARPLWVFTALLLALALIPTYAAPGVGPLLLIPGAVGLGLMAAALTARRFLARAADHMTAVDWAVLAFFALMAISVAFSPRVEPPGFARLCLLWLVPYLGARLAFHEQPKTHVLAGAFAASGLVVLPFVLYEAATGTNPFLALTFNSTEAGVWAESISRFGELRPEAGFGHPISLSMFLTTAALLCLGMGVHADAGMARRRWLVAAVGLGAAQALALSRTGWLMLCVGVGLLAMISPRGNARRRLGAVVLAVFLLLLSISRFAPVDQVQVVTGGSSGPNAELSNSGDYRQGLLERALEPGVLGAWGNASNKVAPAVDRDNFATDNQYINLADEWGLIPLGGFVLIPATLLYAAIITRRRGAVAVVPIAALTNFVGIFFVAFITQQQVVIWVLVGASAGLLARCDGRALLTRPEQQGGIAAPGLTDR